MAFIKNKMPAWRKITLLILLMSLVFSTQQLSSRTRFIYAGQTDKPTAFLLPAIITIGALLIVGKLAKDGIDDSISKVDDATRERLAQARVEIERIIKLIDEKYKDNLNLTIESLDDLVGKQFTRVYQLISEINQEIQRTIGVIEETAVRVIERAAAELRQSIDYIEKKVEQIVIVAAESGVWVIDNVWETIISVVALLFLSGLLLLIYAQVAAIVRTEKLPSRIRLLSLGGLSLALFGIGMALLLSKPIRLFVMTRATSSLQERLRTSIEPQIYDTFPNTLAEGKERELKIVGSNLPNVKPVVKVGAVDVAVKSFSENFVVVTVSGASATQNGSQPVVLQYAGLKKTLSSLVEFIGPGPDLVIESLVVRPEQPTINQPFTVKARVRNQGSEVSSYSVEIQYGSPDVPPTSFKDGLPPLKRGETFEMTSNATLAKGGKYVLAARITSSTPEETSQPNKENNRVSLSYTVVAPPPPNEPPKPTRVPVCQDDECNEFPPVCRKKPYLPQCSIP